MKALLWRMRRIVRWPLVVALILFVGLLLYRLPGAPERVRTEETVAKIHAQRLTMEHVDGKHLPPPPDPALVDATIEGVDANANGIRDDVELAIFEKYPDDIKVRAAELQYSMALQMYLTEVFNSETWAAAVQQTGRGYGCIFETLPDVSLSETEEKINEVLSIATNRREEVDKLIFNMESRKQKDADISRQYTTTYGGLEGEDCDLDI